MSPGPERKLVTVLFCDLVGSTRLGEQLDAETLHALKSAYFGSGSQRWSGRRGWLIPGRPGERWTDRAEAVLRKSLTEDVARADSDLTEVEARFVFAEILIERDIFDEAVAVTDLIRLKVDGSGATRLETRLGRLRPLLEGKSHGLSTGDDLKS
jgi:hypothetical protein